MQLIVQGQLCGFLNFNLKRIHLNATHCLKLQNQSFMAVQILKKYYKKDEDNTIGIFFTGCPVGTTECSASGCNLDNDI